MFFLPFSPSSRRFCWLRLPPSFGSHWPFSAFSTPLIPSANPLALKFYSFHAWYFHCCSCFPIFVKGCPYPFYHSFWLQKSHKQKPKEPLAASPASLLKKKETSSTTAKRAQRLWPLLMILQAPSISPAKARLEGSRCWIATLASGHPGSHKRSTHPPAWVVQSLLENPWPFKNCTPKKGSIYLAPILHTQW